MNYYFRYFNQYSKFFDEILSNNSHIYFNASYLFNFKDTCYNLISKKNHFYFIDPETYKFIFGGDKPFYLTYIEYFKDIEGLFDDSKKIDLDLLRKSNIFHDFYKKIIRFQKVVLAKTTIPLDYYISIIKKKATKQHFNPIEKLDFTISPYFQFSSIYDENYQYTLKYSQVDNHNYTLLRFPKEILNNLKKIEVIYQDFSNNNGILLNIIDLDQYNSEDLNLYFPNLIDLIHLFAINGQKVILMNNSELGKYFKYFGLENVCSNVMIGQKTMPYNFTRVSLGGGNTNFVYIPQIERSVPFGKSNVLIKRNKKISKLFSKQVSELDLISRVKLYYDFIEKKIININKMDFKPLCKEINKSYAEITYELHRDLYNYILKWNKLLKEKYIQYKLSE